MAGCRGCGYAIVAISVYIAKHTKTINVHITVCKCSPSLVKTRCCVGSFGLNKIYFHIYL